jgi:hypothetical protein
VGYIKGMEEEIHLINQKPIELKALSNVDSNYSTDKEDRRGVSK